MKAYSKFIAALAAALTVAGTQIADGTISTADWIAIAAAFLGAIGVYAVTNEPA